MRFFYKEKAPTEIGALSAAKIPIKETVSTYARTGYKEELLRATWQGEPCIFCDNLEEHLDMLALLPPPSIERDQEKNFENPLRKKC